MDDDLKRIANRIRSWRDEAGLTLQQLGDRSGVSASTIHKIENLQTVPTIAVLLKVANGLNRRPSELLAEAEAGAQVGILRAGDRQVLTVEGRATIEHLAASIPRNRLEVWHVELEPNMGPGIDDQPWEYHGELIVMCEDGDLEFEIGDEAYKIGKGDSIHFDTSLPHRWYSSGGRGATIKVCLLLPERLQGELMTRIAKASGIGTVAASSTDKN